MTPSGDLASNQNNITPRGGRITATPSRFTNANGATPLANKWSQGTPTGPSGSQTPTRFAQSGFSTAKPGM